MHNENVNWEITTERLTITLNLVTPEEQPRRVRKQKWNLAGCRVTAGLGLGWQIIQINDVDHSGSDWGSSHSRLFLPQRQEVPSRWSTKKTLANYR